MELKTKIERMEVHLCDHCNLNCSACSHFSNIANERYLSVQSFEKDIKELSTKLSFKEVKLLGGETLLHPNPGAFVQIAREYYPNSKIIFITNGVLLNKYKNNDSFWSILNRCSAEFWISIYPPFSEKIEEWKQIVSDKGVYVKVLIFNTFHVQRNFAGDSDPDEMYTKCKASYCRQLRDGRMYICPQACYMDIFNEYFDKQIPVDKGIDIYESTAEELVEYLSSWKETCRYCREYVEVPWEISQKKINEWGE